MIIRGGMGGFDPNARPGSGSFMKPGATVTVMIPPPPGAPPSTPPTSVSLTGSMALTQIGQAVRQYQSATNVAVAKEANAETQARTAVLDQALHTVADQRDQAIHIASQLASGDMPSPSPGLSKALVIGGLIGAAGLAYLVLRRR